ncbi:hypothetical protein C2857_000104 [Epichloe festucae Fl1]|uniref:xylan 1,4-beta-xylosidase n=1 Tax=Epichloe festucae (strain Fl1) TaxID=877507 RepID=A0A7U3SN05_EPIFF|nr:hypothetical protein C2857_000104 [Epichloe festucae Fl1]
MIHQHWLSILAAVFVWVCRGDTRSCLPAYDAKADHVGCFHDQTSSRDLKGPLLTLNQENSPQYCANACGAAGFSYSGVESGTQCFCGHQIEANAAKSDETSCNAACPGKAGEKCGGAYMINIYKIQNPVEKGGRSAAGIPACDREPLCSNKVCDRSLKMSERASALVSAMTLEEKISNVGNFASGSARLGLPPYQWWNEALHGPAYSPGVLFQLPLGAKYSAATSFPMPISMSAAFDDSLIHQVASVIGTESRAFGNAGFAGLNFWTPNINPFRDPRWGRGMETPGEDPNRIQGYVYNLITGFEGDQSREHKRAMATCKHYAAYDVEDGREANDLKPTPQDMADYYLPMFQTCVRDAKVSSVMCAYNSVYGVPSCASTYLLQDILRHHWNFTEPYNYVVSDCDAIKNVYDPHHFAPSLAAAAAESLNAGTDLDCGNTYAHLNDSIASHLTSEATLDKSLIRLYSALIKAGYFDAVPEYSSLSWADVNTAHAQKLAYQAAVDGMTLLKNDGTLPLKKGIRKVALVGPWANATTQMQGNYQGTAPFLTSPLSTFRRYWPQLQFEPGTNISSQITGGFAAALSIAKTADCIIFMGGIDATVEREGHDRTAITWPGNQLDLISQLSSIGKPLVVVQFGGGQVDDAPLLRNNRVGSVLWAGYPGQDGGKAVLDVLNGDASPAGRLPITQYPASYVEGNDIKDMTLRPSSSSPGRTYMWYTGKATLPFGHGLHYTKFSVTWNRVPDKPSFDIASLMSSATGQHKDLGRFETFSINVKNEGGPAKLASDYVGLLFLSSTNAGPAPYPRKRLVAYGRLRQIEVGTSKKLDLTISMGSLARADGHGDKYIYPGDYVLAVDNSEEAKFKFKLTGDAALVDSLPRTK